MAKLLLVREGLYDQWCGCLNAKNEHLALLRTNIDPPEVLIQAHSAQVSILDFNLADQLLFIQVDNAQSVVFTDGH